MSSSYRLLKSFHDPALGEPLVELLQENNIPFDLEDTVPSLDVTFTGSIVQHQFRITVPASYFEEANALVEKLAQKHIDETPADEDHYLYEFSDDELIDVLVKKDEWSKEDILISRKILSDRSRTISDKEIERLWQERLDEFRKPERAHWGWVIFVIIFSPFLGVVMGWYWMTIKKTDPTGYKSYAYDTFTQTLGKVVAFICLLFYTVLIFLYLSF